MGEYVTVVLVSDLNAPLASAVDRTSLVMRWSPSRLHNVVVCEYILKLKEHVIIMVVLL